MISLLWTIIIVGIVIYFFLSALCSIFPNQYEEDFYIPKKED